MKITKPGEYRMRNGLRAWVKFRRQGYNGHYPWVGEAELDSKVTILETWTDDGLRYADRESPIDIMPPEEVRYCNVYFYKLIVLGCGTLKKSGYDSQDILNSFVKNLTMLYSEPASTLIFRSAMNA